MTLPIGRGHYWIVVPQWDGADGFQHYKNRDPIWIKNYRSLLSKDEYLTLTFHVRGVLHGLWLEYATSNRQLRDNTLTLTRRLGQRVFTRDLISLNHACFISFVDSNPLAPRYRDASPEKRREEKPPSFTPELDATANPRKEGIQDYDLQPLAPLEHLATIIPQEPDA